MKKLFVVIVLCLACLGITVGASCITSREFTDIATAVRTYLHPVQLTTKFKFRCGPMMILAANTMLKHATENSEITEYLSNIRKIQVGLYEVQPSQRPLHMNVPPEVEKYLSNLGWETFVRVRQDGQQVRLFYKQISERIAGVYAVVSDQDRWVVVEVQGDLEQLITKVLQEHRLPLDTSYES